MLADAEAMATIAVKDIRVARKFYEGTLGFKPPAGGGPPGVVLYSSGSGNVLVYESQFAGTNKATSATWAVDDVDRTVKELKGKGVSFEHYDFPGMTRQGDVHVAGKIRNAWFKDPDGNILSVVNRP
jgi:catechol 2,3-dioxygenase-like lactoylglutathione lyase family enzyme